MPGSKFLLASICLVILAAGCGGKKEKGVTLAVGGAPAELDFWDVLIGEFEGETGIDVDMLRQPTDTDQRRQGLVVSLKSEKSDPDVFLMDVAWVAQFAASNWLEPLRGYIDESDMDTGVFFSKVLNLADVYGGNLVALPVYVDGGLLYYRKDVLREYGMAGPPETWGQLLESSLRVQKRMRRSNPNFYGFVWQGAQYEGLICNFIEFAGSNMGGIVLKDGEIFLNLPENVEAVQFMHDLISRHKISPPNTFTEMKEEEVRNFFQRGDALFERNWPYAWALHQRGDSKVKGRVGIAPLPHFPSGRSVSTLGGWHVGISRFSDAKLQSFELLRFITSYTVQKRLALKLGWNPGRRDVYADGEIVEKLPHFVQLREVFEKAQPRPNLPYYTQVSEVVQRYLSGILAGELTSEAGLAAAEKEARKVVARYRER
ncbi:MAG: ABC transporter substrate-binding protein [bacterium]